MSNKDISLPAAMVPWAPQSIHYFEELHKRLAFQAAAVGVFHAKKPQADEILAVEGFTSATLTRWCAEGWNHELFRVAGRKGLALVTGAETGDADLSHFDQVLALALPQSPIEQQTWWLVLGIRGGVFPPLAQQEATLILRQWQVAFEQSRDPAAGRLLLGQDNRLIMADPWTRVELLHHPQMLEDLLGTLRPVIEQRYPDLKDGETRDLAMQLAGRDFWVCFHRSASSKLADSSHWYLELHPLEEGELPPLGPLSDDRISRSLAYIHENFSQSPSLAETAEAAHVSPFHFHRLFSQAVGISPKQYVQKKQLQVARFLLRTTRSPVGDVAAKAGFSSHGHFTSTFHRIVGQSPRDYRESH